MSSNRVSSIEGHGPALAVLDISDVPPALSTLDALAKEAPIHIVGRGTVQPGRYLIVFSGSVEAVEFAYDKAIMTCGEALADSVLLPFADERITPSFVNGTVHWPAPGDTLAAFQLAHPPTMVATVDAALKGAYVELVTLRLSDGLGGRAVAYLWGETHDVEAAVAIGEARARAGRSDGLSTSIVRNADPEVIEAFRSGTTFFGEWRG